MTVQRVCVLALVIACPSSAAAADPTRLADTIDSRLAAVRKAAGVETAGLVDDATFLRRATLDLLGRIPTVAEVREFLRDPATDKRAKLVNRLIESGAHSRHLATFWRRNWVPQADTPEFARLVDDFEAWVAVRIRENAPYDRIVLELLTIRENSGARTVGVSPSGFFAANESKPENLAASASRAFLGVNLDCAQCHDHPFTRWTRDQFWQTAAFFAPARRNPDGHLEPGELTIPNTKKSLTPELLHGDPVKWPEILTQDSGRRVFADWVVAKANPYFARNVVNRLWSQFYGTALVEPLDDLSGESGTKGIHTDLLKELAEDFQASGFDLRYLTQVLTLTKSYQLRSLVREAKPPEPQLFARMPIRGLTGEQLYDSIRTAAGLPPERADVGRGQGREARSRFAARFHIERPVAAERSITQALSMMNSRLTTELTSPDTNATLSGVIDAPFLDTAGKVETLFLAVLGRKPLESEVKPLIEYVSAGGTENNPGRALGDIFWVLVNSTEFNTNH